MKRIKSIHMKNFQSHKNSIVEFHPGLNAIIGETNSGKTSILRDIELVCENRPLGADYIKNGESVSTNTIVFSDGVSVTRERGKSENSYSLEIPGQEPMRFEGFGTSVPDQIRESHGMERIQVGDSKENINIAKQLDGPFMLKDSPQTRAYVIGFLAKTEITDDAIVLTNSDVRSKNAEFKAVARDIQRNEDKLTEYLGLNNLALTIEHIDSLYKGLGVKCSELESIKLLSGLLSDSENKRIQQENILSEFSHIEKSAQDIETLIALRSQFQLIMDSYRKLSAQEKRKKEIDDIISDSADYDAIMLKIQDLERHISDIVVVSKSYSSLVANVNHGGDLMEFIKENRPLENISEAIEECQNKLFEFKSVNDIYSNKTAQEQRLLKGQQFIKDTREELDINVKDYGEAISNIGKCPLCFSSADDIAIEKIKTELRG